MPILSTKNVPNPKSNVATVPEIVNRLFALPSKAFFISKIFSYWPLSSLKEQIRRRLISHYMYRNSYKISLI